MAARGLQLYCLSFVLFSVHCFVSDVCVTPPSNTSTIYQKGKYFYYKGKKWLTDKIKNVTCIVLKHSEFLNCSLPETNSDCLEEKRPTVDSATAPLAPSGGGFWWWVLLPVVLGAVTLGAVVGMSLARRLSSTGNPLFPAKARRWRLWAVFCRRGAAPAKVRWVPRPPAPAPVVAPALATVSQRVNSFYQAPSIGHVYATPDLLPVWSANEHVHVYEAPPDYVHVRRDCADVEIDTSALRCGGCLKSVGARP